MPLHILAGVACGGLLLAFTPRLRRTIRHWRTMHHALAGTPDPLAFPMAARMFAHEVDELLARRTRATGERLHIHTDSDGGTHYDMAPADPQKMSPLVACFHRASITDTQPSVPTIAAVPVPIAYRAYSGITRSGSFGRTLTAIDYNPRITRVLPTVNDEMEAL